MDTTENDHPGLTTMKARILISDIAGRWLPGEIGEATKATIDGGGRWSDYAYSVKLPAIGGGINPETGEPIKFHRLFYFRKKEVEIVPDDTSEETTLTEQLTVMVTSQVDAWFNKADQISEMKDGKLLTAEGEKFLGT